MITKQRDKFLTEYMGECWHDLALKSDYTRDTLIQFCKTCGYEYVKNNNFSTWEGFVKLFEWAQKQEWWKHFFKWINHSECSCGIPIFAHEDIVYIINTERFADAVYEFLIDK